MFFNKINYNKIKLVFLLLLSMVLSLGFSTSVSALIELDDISLDPAIIAAGDEVDIIVQYNVEYSAADEFYLGNPDYKFKVWLTADDTLTKDYAIIQDEEGDGNYGRLYAGNTYNKVFRVKFNSNAPSGNYEFKLAGQWFKNDEPQDTIQTTKLKIPVKKEGIILDISTITTKPGSVRPGDKFVQLSTYIENVGLKDSKSVEIILTSPEGIESSYSNNNRISVGRLNAGESKEINFYLDLDEDLTSDVYDLKYTLAYMDVDDNSYAATREVPFLVKTRPYLEVVSYEGTGKIGETSKLYVTLKNTGEESAEAVDVRIIKQNSQPFEIDVRSDYIGELEAGEEGVAVFDIKSTKDATEKEHDFKLLIRSKGDTDEGDDNIYTYNRRAKFIVDGKSTNYLAKFGVLGALFVGIWIFVKRKFNK